MNMQPGIKEQMDKYRKKLAEEKRKADLARIEEQIADLEAELIQSAGDNELLKQAYYRFIEAYKTLWELCKLRADWDNAPETGASLVALQMVAANQIMRPMKSVMEKMITLPKLMESMGPVPK